LGCSFLYQKWNIGRLEYWKHGFKKKKENPFYLNFTSFQFSSIPSFQDFNVGLGRLSHRYHRYYG
jgi:hypothetical protein